MIELTSQTIGYLVLATLDSKTRDVESVISDFKRCLNHYDAWAESFFSFSALDIEQVFKVGDEVALVAPINRSLFPSTTTATCQANGTLTLVHMFQSSRFVPIGNTPVMVQRIDPNGGPLGEPIHKTIGPSGILEITECDRNQQYRVSFYPNVSNTHFKALYASYQAVLAPWKVGCVRNGPAPLNRCGRVIPKPTSSNATCRCTKPTPAVLARRCMRSGTASSSCSSGFLTQWVMRKNSCITSPRRNSKSC